MKSLLPILFIVIGTSLNLLSQDNASAQSIIDASISYHDPQGLLDKQPWTMSFEESRPDGSTNNTYFRFDPRTYDFEVTRGGEGKRVVLKMADGQFSATLNGSTEISEEDAEQFRIDETRATFMRNYYHYLWAMPMKLKDPGTIVDPVVETVDFFGKESLQIKVTYTPEVGGDIWYFYFHPTTKALQGYRFYHDEEANDGEYILLDGELDAHGVKIPQSRKWITHKDDKVLGTDKVVKLEIRK